MLVLICFFVILTGEPHCEAVPVEEAVQTILTLNTALPWEAEAPITPPTIYPVEAPPADYSPINDAAPAEPE